MGSSSPTLDERNDAELISAVRSGEVSAYGELFTRHVAAARRLARQLVPSADVDDLVSEAFAKVLGILQRGGGPDLAFRAYLLTSVRRAHVDRIRASARLHTTDDLTPFDPGVPFRDTAVEGFESGAAARAFASLPERWQLVLWHTEVEEQKPADVAPLLGMSPNAVSALAYRAREGLRQAYLTMHVSDVGDDDCERTRADLGGYVRGGLSRRDVTRVEEHLQRCRPCTALYLELTEVNSDLRAVLAPLLLGTAAAAYLAAGGVVATTGLGLLLGRARDLVLAHGPTAAVAGAAASVAVVGGLAATLHRDSGDAPDAQEPPAAVVTQVVRPADDRPLRHGGGPDAGRATDASGPGRPDGRGSTPGSDPTPSGPTDSASSSSAPPGSAPVRPPTQAPSQVPTQAPTQAPSGSAPGASAKPPSALVDVSAHVSIGPDGLTVGLGLGLAGLPVVPDATVRVP